MALFLGLATACADNGPSGAPSNPATETFAPSLAVNISDMTRLSEALYIKDLVVGTGATANVGRTLSVTYTGWLVNGTQFDSNVGKTALSFPLGQRAVIDGWDAGLVGMHVGGKRLLVIGSDLAYGANQKGPLIAPNSTLVFNVQLLGVQ
ncbi:MAG: FKBP-type peptidyl-prolyl cis-trans isomerase [bacterium]